MFGLANKYVSIKEEKSSRNSILIQNKGRLHTNVQRQGEWLFRTQIFAGFHDFLQNMLMIFLTVDLLQTNHDDLLQNMPKICGFVGDILQNKMMI